MTWQIELFNWTGYILIMIILFALIVSILALSVYALWHLVINKGWRIFRDWKLSRGFCFDNLELFKKWMEDKK